MNSNRSCSSADSEHVLVARLQCVRTADVDALQAAGALPGVDGGGEQPAGARLGPLHRVEEGAGARHRVGGQLLDQPLQVVRQRRLVGGDAGGGLGDELVEGERLAGLPVRLPDLLRERVHLRLERVALEVGQAELGDPGEQQLVDLVHRVRDRRVGAGQGALEAAGAQVGMELRDGAPEHALVLGGGRAGRHEQPGAGQDRGLADGPLPERLGDHVVVVVAVEQPGRRAAGGVRALARCRQRRGVQRQRLRQSVDLDERRVVVVDLVGGLAAGQHHGHVALDDGVALAPELLGDLLADLVHDRLLGRTGRDRVDVPGDGADEGDSHHPGLELRRAARAAGRPGTRRARAGGCPCSRMVRRAFLGRSRHTSSGDWSDCITNMPPSTSPRSGSVWWNTLWSGAIDDLDVLELGVGELHRLRAEGDVVVGRGAALLRAVLGRGLRVQLERAGQDVGEQLAGGDGAVPADGVEPDPQRAARAAGAGSRRSRAPSARSRDTPPAAGPGARRSPGGGSFSKNCEPR